MIIGTTLVTSASGAREYFTPWFPRGADNALFVYQVIHSDLTDPMSVVVCHKDGEDAGSEVSNPTGSTFSQLGSTGFYQANSIGLKELVRFKVTVPGAEGGGGIESVVFRFLPPTWYSTARV